MTSEQRLDRLERIAKLFVSAGLRARRNMKDQAEKIDIIINNQIEHDERLAALNQSIEQSSRQLNQSIEQSSRQLNQSIERSSRGLNHSIEQSHREFNQSIERSHNELSKSLEQSHNELSHSMNELAQAQAHTDRRLNSLIEIVERDRNGTSH